MKIILDDVRAFPNNKDYHCVRAFDECVTLLLEQESIEFISLDYDLGYQSKQTGLSVLEWMKEHNLHCKHINIHSDHPEGKIAMKRYAKKYFKNSVITTNAL